MRITDAWIKKLEATPHQEYNIPEYKDPDIMLSRVLSGKDLLGREELRYEFVPVDETFPKFIRDNIETFKARESIYMHPEALDYVARVKGLLPQYFDSRDVLEVGSLIINGTPRVHFTNCWYHGIDLERGNGVDYVTPVTELARNDETFDVVVCTEMLEHDKDWEASLRAMYRLLKSDGLLLITCAGPTRPEHGTTRTDTYSSPFTTDYYRNISKEDLLGVLPTELFSECEIGYQRGEEDLNFYGIKRGEAKWEAAAPVIGKVEVGELITSSLREASSTLIPIKSTKWTVTACISTKDRYFTTLPLAIAAVATQTHPPNKLKIYDDGAQLDLREMAPYDHLLKMLDERGIEWEILTTPRQGQVINHQHCLDAASTDFIWRIDDDELPMPDCLERLMNTIRDHGIGGDIDKIGAVGGLVRQPGSTDAPPAFLDGTLKDIDAGLNLAWYKWRGSPREVQHLYSTFLYRVEAGKRAGGYPTSLSTVGHREESIFSHSIYRAGFKVIITPDALTYHLRQSDGGIRSFSDPALWERDEAIWQSYRKEWGLDGAKPNKLIVLDAGIGDHLLFKGIWAELNRRHPEQSYTLALCYPEVFNDIPDANIISIADAKQIVGDRYDSYSVYKWAWQNNWKGSIVDAMLEFYA